MEVYGTKTPNYPLLFYISLLTHWNVHFLYLVSTFKCLLFGRPLWSIKINKDCHMSFMKWSIIFKVYVIICVWMKGNGMYLYYKSFNGSITLNTKHVFRLDSLFLARGGVQGGHLPWVWVYWSSNFCKIVYMIYVGRCSIELDDS